MQATVKSFKKYQNVPMGAHRKRQILFHRFLHEYIFFLITSHSFQKEKEKFQKIGLEWRPAL